MANRSGGKRTLDELDDVDRRILAAFAQKAVGALPLSTLAVVTKLQTREIESRLSGPLRDWIDATFHDQWELRSSLEELLPLARPVSDPKTPIPPVKPSELQPSKPKAGSQIRTPHDWQTQALAKWRQCGRRGIVEAVTGTGKTHVGVMAIAEALDHRPHVHPIVVVPTIPIMHQWVDRLQAAFPGRPVARRGDGLKEDFSRPGTVAVVAVVNSLVVENAKGLSSVLGFALRGSGLTFLIADECHHYVEAPVFSRIRQFPFDWTLGLSATVGDFEVPGLGRIVYEYKFVDAHADGLIPSFDMVNGSVNLTIAERNQYMDLDNKCRDALATVLQRYDLEMDDPAFWVTLKMMMGRMGSGREPLIEKLFVLYFQRAAIAYQAEEKLSLAQKLIRHLVERSRKKVMVFFERIDGAEEVGDALDRKVATRLYESVASSDGVNAWVYHSQMSRADRTVMLSRFRSAGPSALLACRCLDEGIDLPDVDASILVSSTQSERQRIQRIGRVLRRGDGNKRPIVVTLSVKETSDTYVTAADRHRFKGVANISEVDGSKACLEAVSSLDVR